MLNQIEVRGLIIGSDGELPTVAEVERLMDADLPLPDGVTLMGMSEERRAALPPTPAVPITRLLSIDIRNAKGEIVHGADTALDADLLAMDPKDFAARVLHPMWLQVRENEMTGKYEPKEETGV